MEEKMSNPGFKLSSFLTGIIIGGILGSTTAGKKLIKKISKKTDTIIDDVNDYIETGRNKAEDLIAEGKKKADTYAKKIVSN